MNDNHSEAGGVKIFIPDWMKDAFIKGGPGWIIAVVLLVFFLKIYNSDVKAIQANVAEHISSTNAAIQRHDVNDEIQITLLRELVRLDTVKCFIDARTEDQKKSCGNVK